LAGRGLAVGAIGLAQGRHHRPSVLVVDVACTPTATECSGATQMATCNAGGQWGDAVECAPTQTCVSGVCTTATYVCVIGLDPTPVCDSSHEYCLCTADAQCNSRGMHIGGAGGCGAPVTDDGGTPRCSRGACTGGSFQDSAGCSVVDPMCNLGGSNACPAKHRVRGRAKQRVGPEPPGSLRKRSPMLLVHERRDLPGERQVHQRRDAEPVQRRRTVHRDGDRPGRNALPAREPRHSDVLDAVRSGSW